MTEVKETQVRQRKRDNLRTMLNARSVAFVGGRGMAFSIDYCRRLGFDGDIWVVNPKYEEIGGVRTVPTVADLPRAPDTAWIAVSTQLSVDIVRELADIATPSAVCYTAGFGEVGDRDLERALIEAAGDMALIGPNCIGFVNFVDGLGLVAGSHGFNRPERGIACIAQSGTIAGNMVMSDRSLPVTHMLSMGNQAVLDLADGIDAVTEDPRVKAIMLYVEGLKDAQAFAEAVRRAGDHGKPIVCLKGGLSEGGRAIALSHTGSLAGTPALYEAFFERLGVLSVSTFPQLLEMSKLLALGELPKGNRVMIETCSGTDSGYAADMADRYGVELPQPSERVKADLRKVLPPVATPMNPLDVTMVQWTDREAQATSLITLLKQPADAAALVINFPSHVESPNYEPAIDAMTDVRKHTGLPCYVITNLPEGAPLRIREKLIASQVVPLQGMEDAFACLGAAARYVTRQEEFRLRGGVESRLVGTGSLAPVRLLDETASKTALAEFGVRVPASRVVAGVKDAVEAARSLEYPVVVKGYGAGLAHKTEVGAVAVGLVDDNAVAGAASAILELVSVEGLLVEKMIEDPIAELIVGIKRDPSLGLALLIGAGGIFTELMEDVVHLILPVNDYEIRSAIGELRSVKLLQGFRGRPRGDVDALVELVGGVSRYAEAHAQSLLELDVNPVLVLAEGLGAVAVDALIRLGVKG